MVGVHPHAKPVAEASQEVCVSRDDLVQEVEDGVELARYDDAGHHDGVGDHEFTGVRTHEQHQFGDLTHRAGYTPTSLRQLGLATGYSQVQCHGQITGSPVRRVLDRGLHNILSKILMTPPEIWSANFLAVLKPGDD